MLRPGRDVAWKDFLQAISTAWSRDRLDLAAGSVAFFAMLSIFPFLLFLVALAGVLINPADTTRLIDELARVAPPAVTGILADRITSLGKSSNIGILGLGAVVALWSASGGMTTLMSALNAAYEVQETRPFWKTRAIAIGMVIVSAVLLLAATFATVVLTPILAAIGGPAATVLGWLRFPIAIALVGLAWALFYAVLPNAHVRFRLITPGSLVGVALWALASYGFSLYVGHFGKYEATYGALGGVIVLLLWLWITANAVLLGAEVNALLDETQAKGRAWRKQRPPAPEREPAPHVLPAPALSPLRWIAGLALLLGVRRRA